MLGGVVAAFAAAAGFGIWRLNSASDGLATIERRGRVRIGYAVEPPYAFVGSSGRVSGESPETARLVAERLRWQIEWIQTGFDALIPELQDDRFDVIAAGLFVTAEREHLVRFARPELLAAGGLLVRQGTGVAPHSYEELAQSTALRAAVLAGSVEESELQGMRGPRLLVVPDARVGATAVETHLTDVLALSYPSVRALADTRRTLQALRMFDSDGGSKVAAAFRPGDTRLLAAWNAGLADVLGSDSHRRVLLSLGFDPVLDVPAVPRPQGAR